MAADRETSRDACYGQAERGQTDRQDPQPSTGPSRESVAGRGADRGRSRAAWRIGHEGRMAELVRLLPGTRQDLCGKACGGQDNLLGWTRTFVLRAAHRLGRQERSVPW